MTAIPSLSAEAVDGSCSSAGGSDLAKMVKESLRKRDVAEAFLKLKPQLPQSFACLKQM
ncbi:MAG: hypothetical protein HOI59_08165 [Nitrospina sp.]|jgi:hypothetical protein|nr:hypothetical protein [Nitrospina sp.]MBT3856089.1 hypothetical protein [Nitrospina sp.]MBT4105274.1 hypothetical protein [Nitrospina sp.]MBT4388608.1 hypothetical protein [Nitrospina sp.]MBT4621615.1 hypothetical protein [Nitrospina sp.]